jgi:hypothetical protein
MEIKLNQKPNLANANLDLLEILLIELIDSKDDERTRNAINDIARFMNNKTSEDK